MYQKILFSLYVFLTTPSIIGMQTITQKTVGVFNTPLMRAANSNDVQGARLLIKQGVNINARDIFNWTALMFAVEKNNKNIVELLLKYSADVHIQDEYGMTPLMLALAYGFRDIAKKLIEHGACIDMQDTISSAAFLIHVQKN